MNPADIERYLQRYNERLDQFGYDPRALGWGGGRERQAVRFQALCDIGIAAGDSILDVGCGFGDLFGYLAANHPDVRYTGVDLNERLLEQGRRIFPEADLRRLDILGTEPQPPAHDWVIACGVFNAKLHHEDNAAYIEHMLARMFALASKGVACDFMSTYVDFMHPDAYHTDPALAIAMARRQTDRVVVRMDYLTYEYALYLRR